MTALRRESNTWDLPLSMYMVINMFTPFICMFGAPALSIPYALFIFFLRYEQPSGYRPAPVDLSHIFLTPAHQEVVNLLAEHDHNVWARERIKQGWTYGCQQVYALSWISALIRCYWGGSACELGMQVWHDMSEIGENCWSLFPKGQDDSFKCLVLSTTQRYSLNCYRGLIKNRNKNNKKDWKQLINYQNSWVFI